MLPVMGLWNERAPQVLFSETPPFSPHARLGAKLAEIAPGDIDVFFLTNGGAEANENAFKIARAVTGRQKILARYRSYHGATAAAISATGDPRRWTQPPMAGVVHVVGYGGGCDTGAPLINSISVSQCH